MKNQALTKHAFVYLMSLPLLIGGCEQNEPDPSDGNDGAGGKADDIDDDDDDDDDDDRGECAELLPYGLDTLRVGTEGAFPPWNYIDEQLTVSGWEMDYIELICYELGLTCPISTFPFAALDADDGIFFELIQAKSYDLLIAGISATEERAEFIDFTRGYQTSPLTFIARVGSGFDPADVAGTTVATQANTIPADLLASDFPEATAVLTDEFPEAIALVVSGEADAAIAPVPLARIEIVSGVLMSVGEDLMPGADGSAMGLRRDESPEVLAAINCVIDQFDADGTFEAVNAKYGDPFAKVSN